MTTDRPGSSQAGGGRGRVGAVRIAALALALVASGAAGDDREGIAFFEAKIRPVLIERCYACHSAQAKEPKAGLRVDSRAGLLRGGDSGPAIEPGRPDDSLLIRVIEHSSEIARMPPDDRLPDAVIDDFRTWVARGAPDPRPGPGGPQRDQPIPPERLSAGGRGGNHQVPSAALLPMTDVIESRPRRLP